jgi:hypothetical protein
MALRKSKYWIFILILIAVVSCEEEVKDGVLPEFKQKLVVSSFISPSDTVSYITVSSNRRIYGELGLGETLGNLSGFVSDNTKEIPLIRTTSGFKFRNEDMQITEGKTYHIKIISDKGLTAESSCTVPISRRIELKVDTFTIIQTDPLGYLGNRFMAKVSITDYPGEEDFYRLYCEQDIYYRTDNLSWIIPYHGFENEFISDYGKDGKTIELVSLDLYNSPEDSVIFKCYILNTSRGYYNYHTSINNYSGGDDPFTEVSPVYSNITGGLGIFAAYTIDSLIYRLN